MNKHNLFYSFSEFIEDCNKIVNLTRDVNRFKWDLCEVIREGDALLNSLGLKYLIANILIDEAYLIEFNVVYSDIYQMPSAYFIIQDVEKNKIISFDEFLNNRKKSSEMNNDMNFIAKGYEISKTNHPYKGLVYNFLYLCKFNHLLNEIFIEQNDSISNRNILLLWLGLVMQIFSIEIPKELLDKLK